MNQGWIADVISRKWSILLAGCIFIVGSTLQTSAVNFGMLVAARFIGGIGVGMWVYRVVPTMIAADLILGLPWSLLCTFRN